MRAHCDISRAAELIGDSLKNRRGWEDYVVLKIKSTRVENSPGDYFAKMNLQRMTAGVEWKNKREILRSLIAVVYIYNKQLSPPRMSFAIFLPRRFVQNEILIRWDDGFNDPLPEICTTVVTGLKKKHGVVDWNGEVKCLRFLDVIKHDTR